MSESGEGAGQSIGKQNVDYRTYRFLGEKIAAIDQRVGELGFAGAINSIFEERGLHINPAMSEETKEVLTQKPTIVVATHPDIGADPLAIMGAIPNEREDIAALTGEWATHMGDNVAKHVIPIYGTADQPTNNSGVVLLRKLAAPYLKLETGIPATDLGRRHVQSLEIAREKIREGGLVVIFPEWPGGRDSEWKSGIGDIVTRSHNPELNIVFAYVEPNEKWRNRARLATPKVEKILGQSTITVDFSNPHGASEYIGMRKHEVTQMLKDQYEDFVAGLESQP